MDLGLKDKVALVTGGSEGIGKAVAKSLAIEGAKVVICARRADILENAAKEIRDSTGSTVMTVVADVTKEYQIGRLFDQITITHDQINILVNNAGTAAGGYFGETTDDDWHADLDLKLFAAIRCSRLVIPHMKAAGGGRIVNVTNLSGKSPGARSVPTSVSRAAGIALTKAMSKDYAKDNILVNTVCIGSIKSGQTERQWQTERASNEYITRNQWYANQGRNIPLGRIGEPEEAGDIITFLASKRASYITGVAINIDGGSSSVV